MASAQLFWILEQAVGIDSKDWPLINDKSGVERNFGGRIGILICVSRDAWRAILRMRVRLAAARRCAESAPMCGEAKRPWRAPTHRADHAPF
jgi:hypothetical protein